MGKPGTHSCVLTFFKMRNLGLRKISFGTELSCLVRRVIWTELCCSSYASKLSSASKLIFFFTPVMCWNFSARQLDFHKVSFIHGWLPKTVLQGLLGCGWEGLDVVYRPLQDSLQGPKHLPVAWFPGRWYFSQVPWHRVLVLIALTKAILSDHSQIIIVGAGDENAI